MGKYADIALVHCKTCRFCLSVIDKATNTPKPWLCYLMGLNKPLPLNHRCTAKA